MDPRHRPPRGARPSCALVLEDGAVFPGLSFGRSGETTGEVVFNTALAGYQEVLTDPSYAGQIVTMTYPHIGNYGVCAHDMESDRAQVTGFVVREIASLDSSYRSEGSLEVWLDQQGIVGICGIDTRALVRHLRTFGAKRGIISNAMSDVDALVKRARASRDMNGLDLAKEVTTAVAYDFKVPGSVVVPRFKVVAYDFGIKRNILRLLQASGCDVRVVPATTTAAEAMALGPDGVFLSNGPGDPDACTYAIESAKAIMDSGTPLFGICLGHQILGIACGGKTYKLKFGHRGANHPVKDLQTGKVEITSQNHGFALDRSVFENRQFELTHVNLNDDTVEGFRHRELPVISVQYHPESSPGPHDSRHLFAGFVDMMEKKKGSSGQ
ncbi:MAG: glutamine-hydrolyzing carbamoyl-phosphate synthase small subunit [Vicinamibacteria bacterium]|nr:glutamine-hydrolyzing carbamoyl-phosphate synthase small subunit [Vicinamibacteria bacterium]